jgi:aspartate/methionine/tyrosine aminotransferase
LTGIINPATTNSSGLGDGIATLAKTHGFTITSDEVYAHQTFWGKMMA